MSALRVLALIVGTGLLAGSALASVPETEIVPDSAQLAAMSEQELASELQQAFAIEGGNIMARHCRIAALEHEQQRRGKVLREEVTTMSEGFCAIARGDYATGNKKLARLEELGEGYMKPEGRMALEKLILSTLATNKDSAAFELHAGHVVSRNWPEEFRDLNSEVWPYYLNNIGKAAAGRVSLRFVEASSFSYLPEPLRKNFVYRAIRPAIAAGKIELAADLALRDPDAYGLVGRLIDRDFAPIWPQLEEAAGPHLSKVLSAELSKASDEARQAPDDWSKQAALANALYLNGKFDDVVKLAGRIDHRPENTDKLTQDQGWVLNSEVKALDLLGRRIEADAVFELLGTIDPGGDRGWVVNFAINRADRLVGQGRWQEALPAAERAVAVAAKHGSPYAQEVAAVDRFCAAIKLNPTRQELASWWLQIAARSKDNVGAAIQAAQCKGDQSSAKRFMREGLIDLDTRETVLRALQPRGVSPYRDESNMFEEPRLLVARDPKLIALYRKYGRDLPANLMPR